MPNFGWNHPNGKAFIQGFNYVKSHDQENTIKNKTGKINSMDNGCEKASGNSYYKWHLAPNPFRKTTGFMVGYVCHCKDVQSLSEKYRCDLEAENFVIPTSRCSKKNIESTAKAHDNESKFRKFACWTII